MSTFTTCHVRISSECACKEPRVFASFCVVYKPLEPRRASERKSQKTLFFSLHVNHRPFSLEKTFTRKLLTRRRKYVCQQTIMKDQAKPYGNSRFCQKFCADVISVLGMTMSEGRDCLKFRLQGSHEEIGSWGHEYVR